jgi:DNA-binding SARP family transcriptional activator/predicted ATPase
LAAWEIQMLGGLRLTYDGRAVTTVNTSRLQALFAHLALNAGTLQSREHLAFLFWPDSTESQARTNLRQLLHHLRSALPDGGQFLEADAQTLLWRSSSECTLDVTEFEACASRAKEAAKRGDLVEARNDLEKAVHLYRGDLLPGLYDEWAEVRRNHLRQKYSEVLEHLVSLLEQTDDLPLAIQYGERLLAQDPLRETSYQTLMRLHALKGDRAGALLVYHQCVAVLQRELDTEPGSATRKLRDQLMRLDVMPAAKPKEADKPFATHLLLVGRKQEFTHLLEAWQTAAQGRASFVLVTGEPGIGKTRLLEEFIAWASRRGVSTAYSRCYAAEGHLAYAPVAAWLRSPILRPVLSGLPVPQLSELARVLPELLVEHPELGVPQPLTESWQRHHFFEALARAVLRGPQPLLLLIDDLQWCDQETMDWLHYLLRLDPRAQLLVAGTTRPGDLNTDHPLLPLMRELNRDGCSTEIALGPLNSDDTGILAAQVSDRKLDAMFIANLFQETEGNPLFVIESVRVGMVAANAHPSDSPQKLSEQLESGRSLSPKVHAVLSARLAQLSSKAQELAGLGATIGRAFTIELLAKASNCDEDAMVPFLDELWQRQIIRPQGSGSYDFSHDKLREVAYAELGPARRRLHHRLIAEAMRALPEMNSDKLSAELAGHYERASLPALAIPLYHRAAKASQQMYADTEAISHLTRALRLLESLSQSTARDQSELELLVSLGPSLTATQGYAASEVGRVYARARMLCESSVGADNYPSVLWGSFLFHVVRGELLIAKELASRLLHLAVSQDKPMWVAGGHCALGCSLFHLGEFEQARERLEAAKATYDSPGRALHLTVLGPELGVFYLSYLAHVLWMLGYPEQSFEYSRSALARAEELAHPFSAALALNYAAMLHQFRGEIQAAAERAEEAAMLCQEFGFSYYLAWTPIIRGWALAQRGIAEEGVAQIRKGLDVLKDQEAGLRGPYYRTLLAQAHLQAGDVDEGLKCLSEALRLREQSGESWTDAEIHRTRGDLLLRKSDPRGAEVSYQRAVSIAKEQGARSFELRAALCLSRMWTGQGKHDQAAGFLRKYLAKFGKGFDSSDFKEVRSLLDELSHRRTR